MAFLHVIPADGFPDAEEYDLKAAETFKIGAAVLLDGNEDIAECGADPASILGFCAHPAAEALLATEPVVQGKATVQKCTEGQKFWITGSSDGTTITTPTQDHVNQSYGVAKDAAGAWYMDISEVAATRVYVHAISVDMKRFKVSVLVANRQAI